MPRRTLQSALIALSVGAICTVLWTDSAPKTKSVVLVGYGSSLEPAPGAANAPGAAIPRTTTPTFSITGKVSGLFPGKTLPLVLTLHNPNKLTITVTTVTTKVENASSTCVATCHCDRVLRAPRHRCRQVGKGDGKGHHEDVCAQQLQRKIIPVPLHGFGDGGLMLAYRRLSGARLWFAAIVLAVAIPLVLGPTSIAQASWSGTGAGSGSAAATTMPTGTAPSGSVQSQAVTISWSAADMANGTAVAGYKVNRYNSSGTEETVNTACSRVITTTTCTEQSVGAGTWYYTVTPVQGNWTGSQSPESAPITVG